MIVRVFDVKTRSDARAPALNEAIVSGCEGDEVTVI